MQKGKYIVVEGANGVGKTTQCNLLTKYLDDHNIKNILVHEPGGSAITDKIGQIIKDSSLKRDPWSNVILFTINRRLSWLQTIEPALSNGTWVISDRSWISTVVYQGFGEEIDVDKIYNRTLVDVSEYYTKPDSTIIIDIKDTVLRLKRQDQQSDPQIKGKKDTFEAKGIEFQKKIEDGYRQVAKKYNFPLLDGTKSVSSIHKQIINLLDKNNIF